MSQAVKFKMTPTIAGAAAAALLAFAMPLAWSQLASPPTGAPTPAAATAPAALPAPAPPAANADAPAATAPAHHGLYFAAEDPAAHELMLNAFKRFGDPAMANFGALTLSPPLPLYSLSMADISNAALPKAQGVTVYLAQSKGNVVADLVIGTDATGMPVGRSIGAGGTHGPIMMTIDAMKKEPTVQKGAYEARILTCNFLGGFNGPQDVLWLKADPGGADLFVVSRRGTSLEQGKLYDAAAFFKILADNMAKQQANPPGRG